MKLSFRSVTTFFLPTALLLCATTARCDETTDDSTPPLINELSQQEALRVKVTLEAQRQPIKEFLAHLSEQSHITLSVPDDSPAAGKLVTAHLEDYSLAQTMQSLEQLYGVRWSRVSEREWRLNQPVGNDFDRYLGQLGDSKWFTSRVRVLQAHTAEAKTDFPSAITEGMDFAGLDFKALRDEQGVKVSQFSPDLQQTLRRRAEQRSSVGLVEQMFPSRLPLIDSYVIKIGPTRPATVSQGAATYLAVHTPNERWALPVIPDAAPAQPTETAKP